MHLILPPKKAAQVLGCDEKTVRRRIARGAIKNVITNGCDGKAARYLIDMTKEYGLEA